MAGQYFGRNAEAYDMQRPHYRDGFYAGVMDRLVEQAGFSKGNVIVEIGSGTGLGTEALLTRGLNIIGVEPDAEMLDAAYKRLGDYVVENASEFRDCQRQGLATARFMHATFEQAVEEGQLEDSYDGVAAITSIHWPIRQNGEQVTAQRIAGLLKPGKRLATIHTPLDIYSERAAEFFIASQAFWPPEYMASLPNRITSARKFADEVMLRNYRPHLLPVNREAWTVNQDMPIEKYLSLI